MSQDSRLEGADENCNLAGCLQQVSCRRNAFGCRSGRTITFAANYDSSVIPFHLEGYECFCRETGPTHLPDAERPQAG
jgi:hypothetical protein